LATCEKVNPFLDLAMISNIARPRSRAGTEGVLAAGIAYVPVPADKSA
jgi:hypothetical protein